MSEHNSPGFSWANPIVILSLDITSCFIEDIGVGEFYSPDLRQVSRAFLEQAGIHGDFHEWAARMHHTPPTAYLNEVSAKCGDRVSSLLYIWQSQLPDRGTSGLLFHWLMLFMELVAKWDADGTSQGLLLQKSCNSSLRLRIRDYVSHSYNVSREVSRAAYDVIDSQWDTMVDELCGCDSTFSADAVANLSRDINGCRFWSHIQDIITEDEASELLEWAKMDEVPQCKYE